jgi:hypothetical protein
MSPLDQLRLVEDYLEPFKGRLKALPDVYTAVFRGSVVEGGDEVALVDSSREPRVYALNKSLDINNDRRITKGELGLAALSVGRFLPAQPRPRTERDNTTGGTAFIRGKGKKPQAPVESADSTAPSDADNTHQPPRPTRSIYVRRRQ